MSNVTIVTGPMRSGTSCVTGLLERCGFDLGRNIRILRDETEHNPKGHFEPDLLFTINERLLAEVPDGAWGFLNPPPAQPLADVAAERERYFQLFIRKFDGNLCKDPLFCLTLPFWEKNWFALQRVIFCLRDPRAVSESMQTRYWTSIEQGLELWRIYVSRFFEHSKRCQVYVFDFDAFTRAPESTFAQLLEWLSAPMPQADLAKRLAGFYGMEYVHWSGNSYDFQTLPSHIRDLYLHVCSLAGPLAPTQSSLSKYSSMKLT